MDKIASKLREIAKVAVAKYFGKLGDLFVAYPNSRSAVILIVKKTGSQYEIISLKQNDLWYSQRLAIAAGVGGLKVALQNTEYSHLIEKETGDVMKDIAMVSREIKKLKYYEKVDAVKAAKILTLKESIPTSYLKKYLPDLPLEGEGLTEKVGPFQVSFDHENDQERKSIEDLINRTIKAVEAGGFSKFLYGHIYVVDKLKGRTIADYSHASDSIRISHKARLSQDSLRTMIHEIGHRIYLYGGVDTYKVRSKYMEAMKGFTLNIEKGTIITDKKNGDQFQYIGIDYNSRTKPYKIIKVENGEPNHLKRYKCSAFFFVNFEGNFTIKSDWLPTAYSRTNHEEWFCEVLSFALTGNKEFLDFIDSIKK